MGLEDFSFDITLVVSDDCLNFANLIIVELVKLIEFKCLSIPNVSYLPLQILSHTL